MKRLTRVILAAGLGSAVVIYFVAGPQPENPLGYDPLETKQYLHDLQLYGGQANVLAAEFNDWFVSLWYGRNLAFTVAFLTVFVALALRFVATRLPLLFPDDTDRLDPPRLSRP